MSETAKTSDTVALVLNRDLLFGSRLRNALSQLGLTPRFVPDATALAAAYRETAADAVIAIIDMNSAVDWEVIKELAADASGMPMLGFGPHVDVDQRRMAKAAGLTRIVSNGQFHAEMAELIERYRRRKLPPGTIGASSP